MRRKIKKVDWLKKQIKAASEGSEDLDAKFIPKLIAAVESAGENLTRFEFLKLFESFRPEDAGPEHCDFMILDTQLCYAADFAEAWTIKKGRALPLVTMLGARADTPIPYDFVKLGGEPEWIQDDATPICPECDRNMVLLAQIKSLPSIPDLPELRAYCFGDVGTLYLFSCCNTHTTIEQCY